MQQPHGRLQNGSDIETLTVPGHGRWHPRPESATGSVPHLMPKNRDKLSAVLLPQEGAQEEDAGFSVNC